MRESFLRLLQGMVLVAAMALISGCQVGQSGLQKFEIKAAGTNALCKDGALKLVSSLNKFSMPGARASIFEVEWL
jgi:hypothetical protein